MPKFINWPLRLAKQLGYTGSDEDRDVLNFLKFADPVRMAEEQNKLILPEERAFIHIPYHPHIEPYFTENTFISKTLLESSRMAWGNDIDILVEGTSHEGLVHLTLIARDPNILSQLNLDAAIPYEFNLTDKAKRTEFVDRIRELYYGSNEPTEDKMAYCEVAY